MSDDPEVCGVPLLMAGGWQSDCGAQSGSGVCRPNPAFNRSTCFCAPGWTGNADFKVSTSYISCNVPIPLIVAMWAISFALTFLLVVWDIPRVRGLLQKHSEQARRIYDKTGKSFTIYDDKSLAGLFPYLLVGWPCQLAMGILKMGWPNDHFVGTTWALSVLWVLVRSSIYIAMMIFHPALVKTLLKNHKGVDQLVAQMRSSAAFLWVFTVSSQIAAVLATLLSDVDPFDPVQGMGAVSFFMGSTTLFLWGQAYLAHGLQKEIDDVLTQAYVLSKDALMLVMRDELIAIQSAIRNNSLLQSIIYLLFCAFPYMWPWHQVFLPISCLIFPYVLRTTIRSLATMNERFATRHTTELTPGQSDTYGTNMVTPRRADEARTKGGGNKSTAFGTADVSNVVEVDDESDPTLLAQGKYFGRFAARKHKRVEKADLAKSSIMEEP